jgi:hypothetical protein
LVFQRSLGQEEQTRRKSRFSEERIVGVLLEYAAGVKVPAPCRKHGRSGAALYKWKAKHGGRAVPELRRLKDLKAELMCLLADAMLHLRTE